MRTIYLECAMGAAGDMLMSALSELLDPAVRQEFFETMNHLGLPGVQVTRRDAESCGIRGTRVEVTVHGQEEHSEDVDLHTHAAHTHDHTHCHGEEHVHGHMHPGEEAAHSHHHHHHASPADIRALVEKMNVPAPVRQDVLAVYDLIAQAEAHAHGCPVEQIHFHEVGTMDAVADITGVCLLMHMLAPQQVLASPVHAGSGHVRCAHGVLPVPAPATAWLLQGIPWYGGSVQGELCTPTGAALLKHFVTRFGPMPPFCAEKIGYGMGTKDFGVANCVRVYLGQAEGEPLPQIAQLCCNLDDMTGEAIGFCTQVLLDAGALDVFSTPIQMKKNRPAVLLTCLCRMDQADEMAGLLLRHTTTLGVRRTLCERYMLEREAITVDTEYGPVRAKRARGWGVDRIKAEYDDAARVARQKGVPLRQVQQEVEKSAAK